MSILVSHRVSIIEWDDADIVDDDDADEILFHYST